MNNACSKKKTYPPHSVDSTCVKFITFKYGFKDFTSDSWIFTKNSYKVGSKQVMLWL